MTRIVWHPHLSAPLTAALVLGLVWWGWVVYRRTRLRFDVRTSLFLLMPRAIVAALLCVALLDPWYRTSERPKNKPRVLALVDVSASMETADLPEGSRSSRAHRAVSQLASALDDVVTIDTQDFDGDMPLALAGLGAGASAATAAAAVFVTDGGDEPVRPASLPLPVHVIGVGSDPAGWNDLAVVGVKAPERIDDGVGFPVRVSVVARSADSGFGGAVAAVPLRLEERKGGEWTKVAEATVDLGRGSAETEFQVEPPPADAAAVEGRSRSFRVALTAVPGELSELDNVREFRVMTGSRRIHVLFFARSLDWNFAQVRRELKRDPDIKLTALYRKTASLSALEGDRRDGDDVLETGFPEDAAVLDLYKPIILGAFPAADLSEKQTAALRDYVDRGGALIVLGGAGAIGGDWCLSPLEPLLPWKPRREAAELLTGAFPVGVPPLARDNPAIAQAAEQIASGESLMLGSVNDVGGLKETAIALLDAAVGGEQRCIIAVEPYGRGQTAGIATDTMWQWGRKPGRGREVFAKLWQQLVRSLAGEAESQGGIRIEWDRRRYQPSEEAVATISVAGRGDGRPVGLRATLVSGGTTTPLAAAPVPGVPGRWTVKAVVGSREDHLLVVEAVSADETLARAESRIEPAARAAEGSRLEVDMPFLGELASRSGGAISREDVAPIAGAIRSQLAQSAVTIEEPLVQKAYVFPSLVLLVLVVEWMMRRRLDLF